MSRRYDNRDWNRERGPRDEERYRWTGQGDWNRPNDDFYDEDDIRRRQQQEERYYGRYAKGPESYRNWNAPERRDRDTSYRREAPFNWEDPRNEHREWDRIRREDRENYLADKPWRPENQGVQRGSGDIGGDSYGGVFGTRAWGGGAEQYSITEPTGNEWYMKQLAKGKHTGSGPSGYKRTDARITEDVCERLTDHAEIDARNIEVSVSEGEVTLTGTVPDRQMKWSAEDVAAGVGGVKEVHNQVRVARGNNTLRDFEAA